MGWRHAEPLRQDIEDYARKVGAVLWQPDGPAKRWYFMLASCGVDDY